MVIQPASNFKQTMTVKLLFHTHLWFWASHLDSRWFGSDFQSFCKVITEEYIVEEIESIMGTRAEQSLPLWVCIPL